MKRKCLNCGREFEVTVPTKLYCCKTCSTLYRRKKSPRDYQYEKEFEEPLAVFHCKWCGRKVEIFNKDDQRNTYCCGQCRDNYFKLWNRMHHRFKVLKTITEEIWEDFLSREENLKDYLKEQASSNTRRQKVRTPKNQENLRTLRG